MQKLVETRVSKEGRHQRSLSVCQYLPIGSQTFDQLEIIESKDWLKLNFWLGNFRVKDVQNEILDRPNTYKLNSIKSLLGSHLP